jgi:TetR/AcrR family transcriptional repressor of nem operon
MSSIAVKDQILNYAQTLVQTRGYNAMSYRDLANEIGIKTSSIHYYFPAKEDLAFALIDRYRDAFKAAVAGIDAETADPSLRLKRYVNLFVETVRSGKICLGGMFASDLATLSDATQSHVRKFFSENEAWLANLLKEGRDKGKFEFTGSPTAHAETIFSMLEGAMMAARLFNDEKRLLSAAKWVQSTLTE